ncbi:2-oxoglutarate and iron-dependent oxygenase domain-containing protein [Chitinophaga sp. CF418]|uniref:2-oxoglutarate and iron-dependent oxygenase domain-containing protein n=1 Tax=Chitinophaga sp. CF418 TaxID=1855287 RepID=UPI00091632F8|nr:2-oxoglutarate and iron-dependent oxygenase domain-containing protein [Chitinophaga sp. CF418]SHL97012.1 Isopenicillin N synthase [Chitinophaga sp. CF418]
MQNTTHENWNFKPLPIDKMNWYTEEDAPEGVPVLDLSVLHGAAGHEQQKNALDALRTAVTESGFFYVKNHGIPEQSIGAISNITRAFYGQPEEYKQAFGRHEQIRGYTGYRFESTARFFGTGQGKDLCMKYTMGPELTPEEVRSRVSSEDDIASNAYSANVFPDESFRAAWISYYSLVHHTSMQLLEAMATALNLSPESKDVMRDILIEKSCGELRFFQYPDVPLAACADVPGNNKDRMAAHFDMDVITLLYQTPSDNGFISLEAMIGENFVKIPAIRGTLVVNLGEILRLLMDNRIKATVHRVVRPPQNLHKGSARDVLVFFQAPPLNAKLRPIMLGSDTANDSVFNKLYYDAGNDGYVTFSKLRSHLFGEFIRHMEVTDEQHEADAHLFAQ